MPHKFVRGDLDKKGLDDLLSKIRFGHLGTIDKDGKPYVVPLDYRYVNHIIYFHGADRGQKMENIRRNPNVCFEVTGVDPLKAHLTSFGRAVGRRWSCVIARGKVEEVLDEAEKIQIYGEAGARMHIFKIQPETITSRTTLRIK